VNKSFYSVVGRAATAKFVALAGGGVNAQCRCSPVTYVVVVYCVSVGLSLHDYLDFVGLYRSTTARLHRGQVNRHLRTPGRASRHLDSAAHLLVELR
ncbi:hypothetical protein M9458_051325, partial [Cirrhinus mrigala]